MKISIQEIKSVRHRSCTELIKKIFSKLLIKKCLKDAIKINTDKRL